MEADLQKQEHQDNTLSLLNVAIEAVNLAKEVSSMTPAKGVFGAVSILLTMIRDSMTNKSDYVELGLACADVCRALDRGLKGKNLEDLAQSVFEAIAQLTTTVADIQRRAIKQNGRGAVSRLVHAKNDKDAIAAWKLDLNRILHVFNTELAIDTHVIVLDIHRKVMAGQESTDGPRSVQPSIPTGELPPPRPRACFGRDKLIQEVVGLAENLTPIALIGPGGIGKTSIALAVLHHDRIKKRFGDNRRFIPCDQFPASGPHFLSRLSKVVGAGVENPEDLTPLRPFLSSMETIIFLDNAESILDPRGPNGREIYVMVEELSEFDNICLCLTSRISTIPPACETLDVPTLSTEAARDTFYRIYKNGEQSGPVNSILEQLDFHPLSITLLATVAQHNRWDTDRLANEWEKQRTDVLHTEHDRSLATAIELSLASPMFQELGPDARELLGVIAFLPQGVNEKNLDRLFPTLSRGTNTLDKLCILSLTYRNNGFVTMLAPLRDYLCPKDPTSSSLLRTTKERYFSWLSIDINPDRPGFEEAQWIRSEDVNVEHLLDAFTSVDINSVDTWTACARFMRHLYWHKKRLVALGPKIKGLPDNHHSKPQCLLELSRLFDSVGNYVEYKQLLVYALRLWRERGEDIEVAETLRFVSKANQLLGLHKEGIKQVEEASGIYKRLGRLQGQIYCWQRLSRLLYGDGQPDAAKEAASRVINLPLNNAGQFPVCECYHVLGLICLSKGQTKDAINHFETALGIASPLGWHDQLFSNHYSLAELFFSENRLADAHTHIEHAKSHAIDGTYHLGRAMRLQARFWYKECKFEEAKSEASRAADVYERLGATKDLEDCKAILRDIEEAAKEPAGSRKPDLDARGAG